MALQFYAPSCLDIPQQGKAQHSKVLPLHIPSCIDTPQHANHPPAAGKPLRLRIQGPLMSVNKLLRKPEWHFEMEDTLAFQKAAPELAILTFEAVYGRRLQPSETLVLRDEYLAWVRGTGPYTSIDYYGITFDYLVPEDDTDPEVLAINFIEVDYDGGAAFARETLRFDVDVAEYIGQKVLAVPRCCQKKVGSQDRGRINFEVIERAKQGFRSRQNVVRDDLTETESKEE